MLTKKLNSLRSQWHYIQKHADYIYVVYERGFGFGFGFGFKHLYVQTASHSYTFGDWYPVTIT